MGTPNAQHTVVPESYLLLEKANHEIVEQMTQGNFPQAKALIQQAKTIKGASPELMENDVLRYEEIIHLFERLPAFRLYAKEHGFMAALSATEENIEISIGFKRIILSVREAFSLALQQPHFINRKNLTQRFLNQDFSSADERGLPPGTTVH